MNNGMVIWLTNERCKTIIKDNAAKGIPHQASAELSLAEYFGIPLAKKSWRRMPVKGYNEDGIRVKVCNPQILEEVVKRQKSGVSSAYMLEQALLKHYTSRRASK